MMNDLNTHTHLTIDSYGTKVDIDIPHSDIDMEELCNAFYTACIGITFNPITVLESMRCFSEERLDVYKDILKEEESE